MVCHAERQLDNELSCGAGSQRRSKIRAHIDNPSGTEGARLFTPLHAGLYLTISMTKSEVPLDLTAFLCPS